MEREDAVHRALTDDASKEKLNRYVKGREMFRPFAPMLTSEALEEFFEVPSGIREEGYEALRYMGVALNAKGDTLKRIPSVCNRDGTARVQVVRDRDDPVSHAVLKAVGRRLGSEVVLNTSLNVGTPIALTIKQALSTMKRAAGRLILVVICEDGEAFLIWRKQVLGLDAVPVDPEVVLDAWDEGLTKGLRGAELNG